MQRWNNVRPICLDAIVSSISTGARVRAPRFAGAVVNAEVGRSQLSSDELRGRFVLLDFWTSCCANCLHVLTELRPLEDRYADVLTVVGVHSPKFAHERAAGTVGAAAARNEIHHPVINDPDMSLWRQYAVKAWPTLVLIDPDGYVVAQAAGEGQVSALTALIDDLAPGYLARGTLRRSDPLAGSGADDEHGPDTDPARPAGLRFPARALRLPAGRTGRDEDTLLVADPGHHQLAEISLDTEQVLRRIGSPRRARPFTEPNGMALMPPGVAPYDLAVADTAAHTLHGIRLSDGAVVHTVDLAAAVAELHVITGSVPAVPSPWDVVWWPAAARLVVAAAGVHLLLFVDPHTGEVEIAAGTTVEGLRDGAADQAWLAQPSGLAVDGDQVWFVDAETSALRRLTRDGQVHTDLGEGLFDFGHVDGPAGTARLQHPLGLAIADDGAVLVADTYNGAVRRYDPGTRTVTTLVTDLAEPADVLAVRPRDHTADDELLVVESAAHRIVRIRPAQQQILGTPQTPERETTQVLAGPVALTVTFSPPPGRALDDRYGPATRLAVSASPPHLLRSGGGESSELSRTLELAAGRGVLHISAQAASCDAGAAAHPACYLARQDWGLPVEVCAGGTAELSLPLLG